MREQLRYKQGSLRWYCDTDAVRGCEGSFMAVQSDREWIYCYEQVVYFSDHWIQNSFNMTFQPRVWKPSAAMLEKERQYQSCNIYNKFRM